MRLFVMRALTVALAIVGGAGAMAFPKLILDATREFLDPDRAKIGATIQDVTARLFATYPGRAGK